MFVSKCWLSVWIEWIWVDRGPSDYAEPGTEPFPTDADSDTAVGSRGLHLKEKCFVPSLNPLALTCVALATLVSTLVTLAPTLSAQCGTELTPAEIQQDLEQSAGRGLPVFFGPPPPGGYTIAIQIHALRDDAGAGGISDAQLAESFAKLNDDYAGTGISFFQVCEVNSIASSEFFDVSGSEYSDLANLYNRELCINAYFANSLVSGSGGICGRKTGLAIYVANGCSLRATFAHEVGHFLNLRHTHSTGGGVECPDGSNCATSGDFVCDTEADPNLSGGVSSSCIYTGSATPPCGSSVPYDPPVRNIMSYSRDSCREEFTPGQVDRMVSFLMTSVPELLTLYPHAGQDIDGDGLDDACQLSMGIPFTTFTRGDCSGDGSVDLSDAIATLAYLFDMTSPLPSCLDACDTNDDGLPSIADGVHLLSAIFGGGATIPSPVQCGPDPTLDTVNCGDSPCP